MEKLIMTAGPTYVNEEVRRALSKPLINPDFDPDFIELYKAAADKLASLLETHNQTLILNGEGILGLEAACASLTEEGDRVLCLDNGIFGRGFGDFVRMYGGQVTYFKSDGRRGFEIEKLQAFLEEDHNFKYATVVHCETPSGIINPVHEICPLLDRYGIISVVDSVSGIGGEPLQVDTWNIDIALGGSQKCLSAPPGLTFLSISDRAWKAILGRKTSIRSFYCNLAIWKDWYENKWFPYTQPVNDIFALEAAADRLLADSNRYGRHGFLAELTRRTLVEGGFELYPVSDFASTVTAFLVPQGIREEVLRNHLSDRYGVMLSGSFDVLAGKVLRIGHMGENCREEKLYRTFQALDAACSDLSIRLKGPLHQIFAKLSTRR